MSGWNAQYKDPRLIPDNIVRMLPPEERQRLGRHCMTQEEREQKHEIKREKELHDRIEALLRIRGITYCHSRMDRKSTIRVGWPDFCFALRGRAVAIEAKMPDEEPTPEQVQCMIEMVRDGWFVRVVRSEKEFLDAMEQAQQEPVTNPDRNSNCR